HHNRRGRPIPPPRWTAVCPISPSLQRPVNMLSESLLMHAEVSAPLSLLDRLADAFNREQVVYSHWKSNMGLDQVADGETDIDLLVDRQSLAQAQSLLACVGFRPAHIRWGSHP